MIASIIVAAIIITAYLFPKDALNEKCLKYDSGGWGGKCPKDAPFYCKSVYVKAPEGYQDSTRCRFSIFK